MPRTYQAPLRRLQAALEREAQQQQQVVLEQRLNGRYTDVLRWLQLDGLAIAQAEVKAPSALRLERHRLSKPQRKPSLSLYLVHQGGPIRLRLRKMAASGQRPTAQAAMAAQVRLRAKSRKGFSSERALLQDPLREVIVRGKDARHGWSVEARFYVEDGKVEHDITVYLPDHVMQQHLKAMAWPETEDLTFSNARYVLCSRDELPPEADAGLRAGTNFSVAMSFGPRLKAACGGFPVSLVGLFVPRQDGLPEMELKSYPLTLALRDSQVENASVHIRGRKQLDGPHYSAMLRGLLKVGDLKLPVWTDLPADDEVLCWRSWLPQPAQLPLAAMDPLMGGSEWRTSVRHLPQFLGGSPVRLLEAGLGVDLLDGARTDAHAIFDMPGVTFSGDMVLKDVRLVWEWSHESGQGLFQIEGRLEYCGLVFRAVLLPPDLTVFASLWGADIAHDRAAEEEASGRVPQDAPVAPQSHPMVHLVSRLGQRLYRLDNTELLPPEAYDEVHLYYSWRTRQLRIRATAAVDEEVVESNWSVR